MTCLYHLSSIVLVSSLILCGSTSFAGDQKGSGGGGVVCRDGQGAVQSVTTLDIYEAQFRGIELDFGSETADPLVIVDTILDRLKRIDPKASDYYRGEAHKFFDPSVSRFVSGINLPFTEDTGPVAPPVGCKIEQIVFQMVPTVPEDRLYTINKDLFGRLDVKNQAVLILHEVIYRELGALMYSDGNSRSRLRVHPNSYYVRYYNERLFAKSFQIITPDEYVLRFSKHPSLTDDRGSRVDYVNCDRHIVIWRGTEINLCQSESDQKSFGPAVTYANASTSSGVRLQLGNASIPLNVPSEYDDDPRGLVVSYDKLGAITHVSYTHIFSNPKQLIQILWGNSGKTSFEGNADIEFSPGPESSMTALCSERGHMVHEWHGKVLDFRFDGLTDQTKNCVKFDRDGQVTAANGVGLAKFTTPSFKITFGRFSSFGLLGNASDERYAVVQNVFYGPGYSWIVPFKPTDDHDPHEEYEVWGYLKSVMLDRNYNPVGGNTEGLKMPLYGEVWVSYKGDFTISKTLHVSSATLAEAATLTTVDHKQYNFKAGTILFLSDDGLVTTWKLP